MTPEQKQARTEPYEVLSDVAAGLLGIEGSGQHMQPMAHHAEPETDTLRFIASDDSDLVAAIGSGATAQFAVTSKTRELWTAMSGPISRSDDAARLDEIWSGVPAAWFDQGREDPKVCLLRMSLKSTSIWTSTNSMILFGLGIARSNLAEEHKPNLGTHTVIDF